MATVYTTELHHIQLVESRIVSSVVVSMNPSIMAHGFCDTTMAHESPVGFVIPPWRMPKQTDVPETIPKQTDVPDIGHMIQAIEADLDLLDPAIKS